MTMAMTQLKQKAFAALKVRSTKEVKEIFRELDLRLKASWEAIVAQASRAVEGAVRSPLEGFCALAVNADVGVHSETGVIKFRPADDPVAPAEGSDAIAQESKQKLPAPWEIESILLNTSKREKAMTTIPEFQKNIFAALGVDSLQEFKRLPQFSARFGGTDLQLEGNWKAIHIEVIEKPAGRLEGAVAALDVGMLGVAEKFAWKGLAALNGTSWEEESAKYPEVESAISRLSGLLSF